MSLSTNDVEDQAIVVLFDDQFAPLARAVSFMVDDFAEAEEIVQEAFTRLLTSRRRIKDLENAPAYLRTVAFNLARSRIRRHIVARRKQPLMDQDAQDQVRHQISTASGVVFGMQSALLVESLTQLPTRQRECLVARFLLELSEAETASALKISKGSVKTHTSRGLAALRATVGAQDE